MLWHFMTLWHWPLIFWPLNRFTDYGLPPWWASVLPFWAYRPFSSRVRSSNVTGRQSDRLSIIYTMFQKGATKVMAVTSSNLNRFSESYLLPLERGQNLAARFLEHCSPWPMEVGGVISCRQRILACLLIYSTDYSYIWNHRANKKWNATYRSVHAAGRLLQKVAIRLQSTEVGDEVLDAHNFCQFIQICIIIRLFFTIK